MDGKDGAGFESPGYNVGEFALYPIADRMEPAETLLSSPEGRGAV